MKTLEIRIISLLALVIFGFIAFTLCQASQNGRYQTVLRENNRMMIIDTRTGKTWESLGDYRIIERPSIDTQK
jgi:hypothetical protein